jgi:hypothetical protein
VNGYNENMKISRGKVILFFTAKHVYTLKVKVLLYNYVTLIEFFFKDKNLVIIIL